MGIIILMVWSFWYIFCHLMSSNFIPSLLFSSLLDGFFCSTENKTHGMQYRASALALYKSQSLFVFSRPLADLEKSRYFGNGLPNLSLRANFVKSLSFAPAFPLANLQTIVSLSGQEFQGGHEGHGPLPPSLALCPLKEMGCPKATVALMPQLTVPLSALSIACHVDTSVSFLSCRH